MAGWKIGPAWRDWWQHASVTSDVATDYSLSKGATRRMTKKYCFLMLLMLLGKNLASSKDSSTKINLWHFRADKTPLHSKAGTTTFADSVAASVGCGCCGSRRNSSPMLRWHCHVALALCNLCPVECTGKKHEAANTTWMSWQVLTSEFLLEPGDLFMLLPIVCQSPTQSDLMILQKKNVESSRRFDPKQTVFLPQTEVTTLNVWEPQHSHHLEKNLHTSAHLSLFLHDVSCSWQKHC